MLRGVPRPFGADVATEAQNSVFPDAAAFNMRDRLAGLFGSGAYRVAIHTFHSFWCGDASTATGAIL